MSWIMHTFHEWRYPLILALWSFRSRGNREGPASGVDYWTERKEIWTSTNQGKIKFFIIFQGVEEIGSPVNMDPSLNASPNLFQIYALDRTKCLGNILFRKCMYSFHVRFFWSRRFQVLPINLFTGGGFQRGVFSDFRFNFFKISDFRLLST